MLRRSCANCARGPLFEDTFMKDGLCVMLLEAKEREYGMRGQHFTISTEWDCGRFRSPVREPATRR